MKKLIIISTLDTKGEPTAYLKERIREHGHWPFVIDVGCGGAPSFEADITASQVAQAAGIEIEVVRRSTERRDAIQVMIKGAIARVSALCRAGEVEGIISIGGMSGTVIASRIMSEVPYNIPKLILSTAASMPGAHRFFAPTGITLMHSLTDISSLNSLLKNELNKAAAAICSMVEANVSHLPESGKPRVAMSAYGYVEKCAHHIAEMLACKYELINFHATGAPEIAMEKLIEEGFFAGVIDLVPSSITNQRFGGSRISWSRRLEVAGEKGIPQVVAPAGVNTVSRTGISSEELLPQLKGRKHYFMDAHRVTVFLNADELRDVAGLYAEKLNKAKGPIKLLVPKRGWLSIEREGSDFYDPQIAQVFVEELRKKMKAEIEIREIDANIDDIAFARAVVAAFQEVIQGAKNS